MAAHYNTAIVPARPYRARDKAKVEVAVQVASGLRLLYRIRQDEKLQNTRFILISADANPQPTQTAETLGAHGLLRKPFTAEVLSEAIDRVFNLPADHGA